MKRYNKPEIAILALAGFLFLAKYSMDHEQRYIHEQVHKVSYVQPLEHKQLAKMMIDANKNPIMTAENARKIIYLFNN